MHRAICGFQIDFSKEESWLLGIAGAAAIKIGRTAEGQKARQELERRLLKADGDQAKAGLAIMIAYLYFRSWKLKGGEVAWRNGGLHSNNRPTQEVQNLIAKAIEFTEQAYEAQLADLDSRLYALNLRLFYITEGGTDAEFNQAEDLLGKLLEQRHNSGFWQY